MVDQQIKWKIEALKEIRAVLKSCRDRQFETLEKTREFLILLPGLTQDRKTGEGQESKTTGVGPGGLEADVKDLRAMIAEGISLFETGFNSQIDFENELLKKMRTTIFELGEDLSDMEKFEKWLPRDWIRLYELKNNIMTESQNFLLNFYNLVHEQMENPNFMEKREKTLKDERKRLEKDRRMSNEFRVELLKKIVEKNRQKGEEKGYAGQPGRMKNLGICSRVKDSCLSNAVGLGLTPRNPPTSNPILAV